jgi:hypothetical protein
MVIKLDEIRNASDIITKTSLIDVYVQTQKTYFAFGGWWCVTVLKKINKKEDSFCFKLSKHKFIGM